MKKVLAAIIFLGVLGTVKSQSVPTQLRVDLLADAHTAFIASVRPRLSWQTDTSIKSITASRILVASSAALLAKDLGDLWDTKKVLSPYPSTIYSGKPLVKGQTYYWKVQVWNEKNIISAYSITSSFKIADPVPVDSISHFPIVYEWQSPVKLTRQNSGRYFADFGKDALCQLSLHIDSKQADSITIEVGELANNYTINKNPGRNIRYTKVRMAVVKGSQDYIIQWPQDQKRNSRNPVQMPEYIGEVYPFRYVAISELPSGIELTSLRRKMVHYPFQEQASSFISSDTILNQVWELCKYSIKATSFTGYYIDGDRERIPYEGDAVINQLSHYAVDAEYSMARRSMAYLLFHPTWPTEWSLQNVLLAWNDYMYTGDDLFIKRYYDELQKKTLMSLAGPNGLISTRTGKQTDEFLNILHKKDFDGRHGLDDVVDWPQTGIIDNEKEYGGETDGYVFTTYNAVINAFYYRNLVLMEKIARVVHKEKDADMYKLAAAKVLQSYRLFFRDKQSGLIKDGEATNHISLHGNMFALAFGLVPQNDHKNVTAYIRSRKMACSVYGAQFLLDGLYDAGMGQYALELITGTGLRSWYNMLRVGSTITMEAWDKVYKPNLDLNHAWGAAPANIIVRKLMGVEPLTPGFEKIRIKPMTGDLSFAKLTTTTIKGEVLVDYKKDGTTETINIMVPGASSADIYLRADAVKNRLLIECVPAKTVSQNGYFLLTNVPAGIHHYQIIK